MPGSGSSPKSREEQLKRRRGHGLTVRKLGDEFGMSKSHAHRLTTKGEKMKPKKEGDIKPKPAKTIQNNAQKPGDCHSKKHQKVDTDRGEFKFRNHKGKD